MRFEFRACRWTLLLFFTLPLLSAVPAMGDVPVPSSRAELERELGLTPEQLRRIAAIDSECRVRSRAISKPYNARIDALRAELGRLRQACEAELAPVQRERARRVAAVLTPTQRDRAAHIRIEVDRRIAALRPAEDPSVDAPSRRPRR